MNKTSTSISDFAKQSFENRLSNHTNYSISEVKSVSKFPFRLFELGTKLDEESSADLRRLCCSYAINKNFNITKSHRPFIGPIIFFFKKALTKILSPLLVTQLNQIENFNRMSVLAIARLYKETLTKTNN